MARYYFLLGLLVLIGFANAEEYTLRGTHWGMTVAEVKTIEKWEYVKGSEETLLYNGELVSGKKTKLVYFFHDGFLVSIEYRLLDSGIDTYTFLSSMLWNKYKKAYEERTHYDAIRDYAYFLFMKWKIHEEKDENTEDIHNKTHLQIFYTPQIGVNIAYESMVYRKGKRQLEKDQSRDSKYSLENSDDL